MALFRNSAKVKRHTAKAIGRNVIWRKMLIFLLLCWKLKWNYQKCPSPSWIPPWCWWWSAKVCKKWRNLAKIETFASRHLSQGWLERTCWWWAWKCCQSRSHRQDVEVRVACCPDRFQPPKLSKKATFEEVPGGQWTRLLLLRRKSCQMSDFKWLLSFLANWHNY